MEWCGKMKLPLIYIFINLLITWLLRGRDISTRKKWGKIWNYTFQYSIIFKTFHYKLLLKLYNFVQENSKNILICVYFCKDIHLEFPQYNTSNCIYEELILVVQIQTPK